MTVGFELRAPWYARERDDLDVSHPKARRPVIQMYDDTSFVTQLTADPGSSVKYGLDDRWSYPVAVTPNPFATGRARFATSRLVHTDLRKLYQPSHSRFYAVVVEVFCDLPGLPRAGAPGRHDDLQVTFVMRRRHTAVAGSRDTVRKLAKQLLAELAKDQHQIELNGTAPDLDIHHVWWAGEAGRGRFEAEHSGLIDEVGARVEEQAWVVGRAGGTWRAVDALVDPALPPAVEEEFPMWRLPPREDDCDAARTRSLWFGLVPTYGSAHYTDENGALRPKLDDEEIYELRCIVTQPPEAGHEHCPSARYVSAPTEAFRLAAAYDPDGTKNRTISITAPDLRRLAARAGQKQGPGGLRIASPPKSALGPVKFASIPGVGIGTPGGGAICSFAFELFFIVALFLFLLFLPIIVLAFQLWWMLALRFCIPPSANFKLVADFFAAGGLLLEVGTPAFGAVERAKFDAAFDEVMGVGDARLKLLAAGEIAAAPDKARDLVAAMDAADAQLTPVPPERLSTPPDPLCPSP